MKKRVIFSLMAIMLIAMTVGSAFAGGSSQQSSGGVTRGMDRKIVMGYSQIGAESEWRTACTNSVKAAATDWNIDLRFSDAQQKQENQLQAIRSFIQQKVDVIAFTPVVSTGWEAILQECKDAGIPTICVDRTVDAPNTLYNTYIGSDIKEEGRKAGRWLVEYMNKIGRGSKNPVNVVELQGTVGSAAATDRQSGIMEILAQYPNYKVIKSQTGNFTRSEGKQVMEAFLKSDGDIIDVLFAHNDDMAIGAIQAIEEYGRKPGTDIIIVSFDAVKGAFEAMIAGKLNASIECNPLLGPQIMDAAVRILKGERVEKWIASEEGQYDQTNAAAAYPSRQY
ncbi:MAG: ABC transporter substrate-binding protein [Spirochaetaceae bacterium]|jgi:simple sugar transport system substrate-binding protein|nr:ABC transporter substrate-binding protein [Spirochaetaceae bacterium]